MTRKRQPKPEDLVGRRAMVNVGGQWISGKIEVLEPRESHQTSDGDRIVEVRLSVHRNQRYSYRRPISEIQLLD